MSETLIIPDSESRKEIYEAIIPQIASLVSSESNIIANLANITSVLKEAFGLFWIGFYQAEGDELVLAPFQGPIACTRIKRGKGVCGSVFASGKSLIVPDVGKFEGHISCSSLSRSEIVIPIILNDTVWGVLDIDSKDIQYFNEIDKYYLEIIAEIISKDVLR